MEEVLGLHSVQKHKWSRGDRGLGKWHWVGSIPSSHMRGTLLVMIGHSDRWSPGFPSPPCGKWEGGQVRDDCSSFLCWVHVFLCQVRETLLALQSQSAAVSPSTTIYWRLELAEYLSEPDGPWRLCDILVMKWSWKRWPKQHRVNLNCENNYRTRGRG